MRAAPFLQWPRNRFAEAASARHALSQRRCRLDVPAGWTDEGIGWYSDPNKTVGLYREYNPNAFANNHSYTTDKSEHDWLIGLGWKDESDNGKNFAWFAVAEAPR